MSDEPIIDITDAYRRNLGHARYRFGPWVAQRRDPEFQIMR